MVRPPARPARPTPSSCSPLWRGAAWCCTADRSGRALLSGLVYSLIAPYTHRSVHAIPTGSKTSLRRSRWRGQATGQWPALGTFGGTVSGIGGSRCSTAKSRRWSCSVRWGCDAIGPCGTRLQGVWSTRRSFGTCRRQRGEVSAGSGVIGPASPSACRRIQSPHKGPHLKLPGAGPFS